jgi:DNA (cytosine-5)-methyltransferase 1
MYKWESPNTFNQFSKQQTSSDADSNGQHRGNGKHEKHSSKRGLDAQRNIEPGNGSGDVAHAHEPGRTEQHRACESGRAGYAAGHGGSDWHDFPTTEPTIRTGNDGLSAQLDGITFPKWRNESIKAAGNAIVPQVAYQIFRAIELYEIQNGAK